MIVRCFQIDDTLHLVPLAPDKAMELCRAADSRVWIDLQDFSRDELEPWFDKLEITSFTRRQCLQRADRSAFYPTKQELMLAIPFLASGEEAKDVNFLTLVCRDNVLLTFHRSSIFTEQNSVDLQDSESWLPEQSIAGLVSAMMIDLSLECLRHTERLSESLLALEDRMDREPDGVNAEEIMHLRSVLQTIGAVIGDQIPTLQTLRATDKPYFKMADAQDYLNCAVTNLQAAHRQSDWQEGRIRALRLGFQMHAQDKTNRRLNLLTILSAVFNPLTLLAGIWGMNFTHMPELNLTYAYPVALGAMALVGSSMYFFFRRNGWFN